MVFRFIIPSVTDQKVLDKVNLDIKNTLFNSGKASVASTKFDSKVYLKFTLLNPRTTKENLIEIVQMIKEQGLIYAMNN